MSLGSPMLPVPDAQWSHQNGGGVNLTFIGQGQHRIRWAVAQGIPPGTYSGLLTVKSTDGADGLTVLIGGTAHYESAASEVGVYPITIESDGTSNLIDVRAEDVTAIFSLQVWPGTPD